MAADASLVPVGGPIVVCLGATAEVGSAVVRAVHGEAPVLLTADLAVALQVLAGAEHRVRPRVAHPRPVQVGALRIDPSRREATWEDEPITLSPQDFRLLQVLAKDAGRVWTFAELTAEVWQTDHLGDGEAVVSAVKRLRRRLTTVTPDIRVVSVRGVGFRLDVAAHDLPMPPDTDPRRVPLLYAPAQASSA